VANLFRSEVLYARQREWLGTVQLTRPVPLWVATGFVLAVAAAVFSFLWLGEYTRKARVTGYLVPDRGVIRLVAPQAATVLESHISEGKVVRQGDTCGSGSTRCASGFVCVVGSEPGKQCVQLCRMGVQSSCPAGLICGELDVEGYGVCS